MRKDLDGVIAVVGMAGRFPGLVDLDRFDAGFFGINHREAEILDPQQRVFLETCWEALEDAGCDPDRVGMTGVFAGQPVSSYLLYNLLPALDGALAGMDPLQLLVGNAPDSLATRVSYKLNLKGPSFTVQAGDSTLGLAVHLARQSLLNGECDLALAGWASIDARTLEGEAAVLVLKRADEALRDGDNVQALVVDSSADGFVEIEPAPEIPRTRSTRSDRERYVLPVSARSPEALERACQRLADWLESHPELDLGDVEHTLTVGRKRFEHQRAVECRTIEEAVQALRSAGTAGILPAANPKEAGRMPAVPAKRVSLPTYPFERRRYWIDPPGAEVESSSLHPRPALFTPYEAPRDEAETQVAAIWQEVLGVAPVGAHDDFFQLGGHSPLAPQILARVRDVFGVDFPLQHVFSFPTPAELAEAIRFLQEEGPPPIPRSPLREAGGPYPLSFSQERLWFIDRLEPGNPIYNEPRAARIQGRLDVAALEASLREIVHRQEALRTTFHEADGVAVQVVSPHASLRLPVIDLGGLPDGIRGEESERLSREEARRPFDLSHGPMLRTLLLRLGDLEHEALFTVHHIASDGWSLDLLVTELGALYGAFSAGLASPLPELPVQYADFAEWQRQQLQGEELERQLAYWREALAGAPTALELPADRPRPAVPTYEGGLQGLALPGLAGPLDELGRREGASRFMTLLAGFQALLHRLSGQADLLVGSPVANRTRPEIEGLVGFFVNLLVLRARFEEGLSFRGLLARVREVCLGAYAHQDLPFEKLVDAAGAPRDLSRAPLFQVMFILQNPPLDGVGLPGLTLAASEVHAGVARYDLTLFTLESGGELTAALEHSSDLFDAATAGRWLGHLRVLLEAVAESPDTPVDELPLLAPAERRQVVSGWNPAAVAIPEEPVHRLFERQAERTPEAVAVVAGGERVTYAELSRRADRLAAHLRSLGVGPEVPVALATDRSPDLLAAVLGTLKAGGAYVPLDVSYPRERLAMIVEDARPRVLVTQRALLGSLPRDVGRGARVVLLDSLPEDSAKVPDEVHPDNLAYVLFTSGSTGRPKGVQIAHRAFVNFLLSMREEPGLSERDTLLAVTTLSFDIAGLELLLPLLVGGRVALAGRDEAADAAALIRLLDTTGATVMQATPATWRMLLDAGWEGTPGLELLCGGEALPGELAVRLLPRVGSVWNLYGPTETTVWSAAGRVTSADPAAASLPIGEPVANTRLYLLDPHLEPAPVGVPGELCIGGAGLARGYRGRPELTAERFVPDPFAAEPGDRMYRTGDLAKRRADGGIDFLGRIDHQVKVRGFRIELGEIEAALAAAPGVRQVAVGTRGEGAERQLVAYVVADGSVGDTGDLREFARERLPEYMVPSAFAVLDAFPLTPNNKVDRKALARVPIGTGAPADPDFVAPRNATEEKLAEIWSDLLDVERIGVRSSFFELGGHSLLGTRLISRLRDAFGVELPLRALFEAPTLEALAARLGPEPREAPVREEPTAGEAFREGALPLSFAQERLWLLDRLDPGDPAYNISAVLRLSGAVNDGALERSFEEIVRRHATLRTAFGEVRGEPVQVVSGPGPWTLFRIDLTALPAEAGRDEARRVARLDSLRPFDLARGPLLRTHLLRLAPEESILLVNLHHIVSDGWSMGVMLEEAAALYEAFCDSREGRPSPLPALPLQYADYAAWQRRWLAGERLESQVAWWRRELAGAPAVLELPTDRPRPPVRSSRGGREPMALGAAVSEALKTLARERGATPFMVFLAAFQALLQRYSGQSDVLVGSPIANRGRSEIERLIGLFVNTLVLRGRFGRPGLGFGALLEQTRETVLGAYANQDLPFERLVEELRVERSLSYTPLFQVMLVLQNAPLGQLRMRGLAMAPVADVIATAKVDLNVELIERADEGNRGFEGLVDYSSDLFDPPTVRRMAEHLQSLIEGILARPESRVSELPLLTAAERHQLLALWNDTAVAYPEADVPLHELIAAQVERTPDAVAVVYEGESLTYRELDGRAAALAAELPPTLVGICAERSLEMVVGLVAILKAGGAYVPLDSAYPADRLAFMLEDAAVPVLLTQRHLAGRLPSHGARVVLLEDERDGRGGRDFRDPERAAYAIFTSGSTGRPKGVLNTHRGIVNRLLWMQAQYGLTPDDRVLQKTPFSFDVSVWEFFWPLIVGARLVVARPGGHMEPAWLVETIRREGITTLHFVPSMLQVFVEQPGVETCAGLRRVMASGEALPADLAQRFFERLPAGVELHNLYGPTEAAVDVTYHACRPGEERVPIGRPVANTRIHLLDAEGNPVPVGVAGELHIGGVQVARGYLRRPDLTAERFVPDPYGPPGSRLYRTGDLARYQTDGEVEYLGRIDHQVKIRGFRIELGEIEAALAHSPEVREAVVMARGEGGEKTLAAFVVPTDPQSSRQGREAALTSALRSRLRDELPEHMVPASFVYLDAMPLSPNGKADRKALDRLAPSEGGQAGRAAGETAAYVAPRTRAEARVAEIWRELLKVERVGVRDNFFELGGHSLLGMRLVARLRESFGAELPLQALFEAPTVEGIAARVEAARLGRPLDLPPILAVPREGDLPLSFAQERLWFLDRLQPGSSFYNVVGALRLRGELRVEALAGALLQVARRHESLRTTFSETGGEPVQRIAAEPALPFAVEDLRHLPAGEREREARRRAEAEAAQPFDLERGPLLRALLLRLEAGEWLLVLVLHHIVSDGWSLGVLIQEGTSLYRTALDGESPALPPLAVQYADYAVWQRGWLRGELLDRQLAWWTEELSGAPTLVELPSDRPRPPVQTFRGAVRPVALPARLGAALNDLARSEGATLFMVLLTAFQALLHRYTGQDDLLLGSPVAGRGRTELEPLIGFFVNTLVLRSRAHAPGDRDGDGPPFRVLLERTRVSVLEAFAHQDLPFERLVEALDVERSLAHNPLVQAVFVLQNAPAEDLRMPGLAIDQVPLDVTTAKFDLSLSLGEGPGGALAGAIEYSTDLFDRATVDRLAGHLGTLLAGVLADPLRRLRELPLLTAAESREAVVERNRTATAYPRQATVHGLFDEWAERNPDALAAVYPDGSWTYRELRERANRLANHLLETGLPPGSSVGIYLERSLDMVAATLAVLKAGGFYVPLDTAYPEERLAFMLADAGAPVLITRERWLGLFAGSGARTVCLDRDRGLLESASARTPEAFADAQSLAYLMYTSGSTGRPKGVAVPHRAIVRLVRNTNFMDLGPDVVVAQASNTSFDAATLELWSALLSGGRLVWVSKETMLSPRDLAEQLRRDGITMLFLTTSVFHQVGRAEPGVYRGLRYMMTGGEAMDPATARQVLRDGAPEVLINGYGPTESTTFASFQTVTEIPEDAAAVPIGLPLANTTLLALDRGLRPVPAGVAGEMFIGGDGLAWGYLNRPDLTAERFVPHPYEPGGERLYRTGDLVRQRPDGVFEFLGRADTQVKIRGFRIEPGEVEAALTADPAVREAAVLVDGAGSDKRLVAYVATGATAVTAAELRERLARALPAYMVPAAWVVLDALPLTPNGKADRRALARLRPEAETAPEGAGHVPPRTPAEQKLAAIWAEVLGVAPGALDDFFVSGGHSLLATRLTSRVREAFGVDLPLRAVFEAPVLADMAARLEGEQAREHLAIRRRSGTGGAPLSFAQERLWFLDRLEPGSAAYNIPLALRLTGSPDVPALERSFEGVVHRHEALRTTFLEIDGEPRQVVAEPAAWTLPVVDLRSLPAAEREAEARRLTSEEAGAPFDLSAGPLLRTRLLRLAGGDWRLLVSMHHIVSDGWSMGVLVREAVAAYTDTPLPELPIQYADYALWQRDWLRGETLEAQVAYWTAELAGAPEVVELPSDRPRPAVRGTLGGTEPFALPAELSAPLNELARREGATLFMVLLAAFQAWLHRYSGQPDILVGSPVANRNRTETEGLIGFFVNTLVLRGRFDPPGAARLTFVDLLDRVRSSALSAYAHQDVPFERLVEALDVERSLSHTPLFQTMFALQNAPVEALVLPGLTLEPVDLGRSTSQFDLSLALAEEGGEIRGEAEYSSDLFDAATVRRLLRHLAVLVEGAVREPGHPLSDLPLLTAAEAAELRSASAGPVLERRPARCLHPLIEVQAARNPQALAVVTHDGGTLTYAELDREADRLAGRLRALGVGPDVPVAVHLHRSPGLVVALLGVLKAGGAYLPLDPGYPEDRLAYILEDSGAPVVVTVGSLAGRLASASARVVLLDEAAGDLPFDPPEVHPENLAYIIYTSGSTGRPKGTGIAHGPAVEHMEVAAELFELAPGERMLQFVSPGFDVSMEEMLPPLLAGATVVPTGAEVWPPERFLDRLVETGVTAFDIPTAYWHHWVRECERLESLPAGLRLRMAAMGGEAMQAEVARLWFRTPLAAIPLWNTYGPTEAIVTATGLAVDEPLAALAANTAGGSIPLGPPLAGRASWVLDPWGGLAPSGVVGELHLGGPMLARGYLHRPELTAERFVPDPFAGPERPGARLYCTGDLVRRLASGQVEFVGRADQQIKIRGFRIELGEIEAALARLPGVREAVVLARDGRLSAYVAAAPETPAPEPAALREALARELPDYMVPAAWAVLGELPLSPNGKVDRRALARMEAGLLDSGEAVAPRTPAEALVAGIWTDLLGLRGPVSVHDNFFALGGHSLLATRLVSRVREAFGLELPLRAVFEAPALADLAARIEALGAEGGALEARPVLAARLDRGPLSFSQERLWFLDRLEPGSTAYNIPAALRLTGALDPEALAASLSEIVRRHEALRTTFEEKDGEPVQVVRPAVPLALPAEDLRGLPDPEAEAARLVREDVDTPFDLARGPLIRARLLRLGEEDWLLILTVHHIVSDGWSTGVMVRESALLYEAFSQCRLAPLPEPAVQYLDFALWQRMWLRGEALAAQLRWWREELAGAPALLELPADRPRPAVQSYRGAYESALLPAGLARALRRLALGEGATLFMVLLAGFEALLHRWSGQDDVLVGSPVANRVRAELEGLIGFFVNTLVLRGRTAPERSFRGLLAGARDSALGAYAHQDLPFEKLVEELGVERSLAHSPLFQVMLVLQNVPLGEMALPGVQARMAELPVTTSKFDLTLDLNEVEEGVEASLTYATDLFDRNTARRLLGHFRVLLEGAVARPDARIADLPLLTEAERAELVAWNRTEVEYPDVCLHELIEAQVERTPDAVAVVFEGESLTYRELDEWASALAAELPAELIGISVERSLEMVVGLVAILKAGGAYVPIDPGYPAERVAYMIEDSGVSVLLDASKVRPRAARRPTGAPRIPDQPAYMIYTSGSTGRPKGALNAHRGIVNRILWMQREYGLTPDDRVLQKTPFSFDVSVWEFFWPLIVGARLVVARPGGHQDPAYLVETIRSEAITTLHFVPSMLQVFVEQPGVEQCTSLRRVMASGEALPADLVSRFFNRLPEGVALHNLYGPTEAAVDVTFHACRPGETRIPIGRPVANTRIHILDREGREVPVGVAGELHIAGVQVGRGYLHRPDLTAERFIPDQDGARMYRTGDHARWLPDGEVEYLGRIDHQVKIRGFRIELGEVEAALARHPAVREAVVLANGQSLVAYVAPPVEADLRGFLRESLPEHMVPSAVVFLDSMPLTPNGKVDRKALARIEPERRTEGVFNPPRTVTEERLAGIWRDLLGVERIGAEDGFFDIGGHSLLGTRVVSRVREAFGVELPLRALFEAPTLAGLAARIEKAGRAAEPPIVRVEVEQPPLSFGQERLWFLDRLEPGSTAYNMPLALRLRGKLDFDALERSLREVVRRHGTLRTTFAESGGVPYQVVAPEPAFELRFKLDTAEETPRPFDLARGPLFCAVLSRAGEDDWRLFVDMHHIVSDGWSLGVLVRESAALYEAFSQGLPSPLSELPVQYTDFAVWQRGRLQGEELETQVRHWREALAGAPALLELPADRPRPAVQSYRGASEPAGMPMAGVRELAGREGATPFMVVLAAFEELLRRWSGQDDVLVGTPIANRTRAEVEGLIGLFVNTLVMRRPAGAGTFRELLSGVRAGALSAYAHQDLPFEKLVEELGVERSLAHSPVFQAMLVLQNAPVAALSLAGLELRPLPVDSDSAKFDLLLSLSEDGEGALDYATDLFDRATVRRFLGHFRMLLKTAVAEPDARLSDLPLLTEAERAELAAWNRT
ncbi:MAG: non-ribosomal peptide synthase/polyketide synthase, partial [Acidobacteriota bacterium]